MAALAALCRELDEAALELLDALESLQQRREAFARCLEQGWLSLSQARYALGCHRVSALQYGAAMEPRVRVAHRLGPGGAPRFEELLVPDGAPPEPPAGPRQRRGAPPEESSGPPPPKPPRDPLTWFGILVPRSLRQAQGSFQQGVSLAVQLAELQGAVTAAGARYRALLRRKRRAAHAGGTGDDGETGTLGETGDAGETRAAGETGTLGETGDAGERGGAGETGASGDVGETGGVGSSTGTGAPGRSERPVAAGVAQTGAEPPTPRDPPQ